MAYGNYSADIFFFQPLEVQVVLQLMSGEFMTVCVHIALTNVFEKSMNPLPSELCVNNSSFLFSLAKKKKIKKN